MTMLNNLFDVQAVRKEFPAMQEEFNGRPAIFFDNPGGTQVHGSVIEAMNDYMIRRNANTHGPFETSRRTDVTIETAHQAMADFFNATPNEVIFGNNMTSLTFHVGRSLSKEWQEGDEIVLTRLDHDANVTPWVLAAEDRGVTVRWVDVDVETGTLDMDDMRQKISRNTKLVAVGYASNATGTINDVTTISRWARESGALSYVDAVQFAPHGLIDVKAIDCDFLACSSYKFFGPHSGQLYGKQEHLERLKAYKVRPADAHGHGKWETGTQNFESYAGVTAAVDYLAGLGVRFGSANGNDSRRQKLTAAWDAVSKHEYAIMDRLITGLLGIPGVRIYGITDRSDWDQRLATVVLRKTGTTPQQLAETLGEQNVFCWHGNFYAVEVSKRMGVEESGGFLRLGLAHYNTLAEVERCLEIIDGM